MEQNNDVKHSEYVKSSIEEENVDLENATTNNINDMVQKNVSRTPNAKMQMMILEKLKN